MSTSLPKASSITSGHIKDAFVAGNPNAARRIEQYGRLNRRILRNIGQPAKKDGTVGK